MTATPSSPMTNPMFAPAGDLDLGLEIAAQTFGPTSFSKKGGSGAIWALSVRDTHRRRTQGRNTRLVIVQLLLRDGMMPPERDLCNSNQRGDDSGANPQMRA